MFEFVKFSALKSRLLLGSVMFFYFVNIAKIDGQLFPGLSGEELADAIRSEYTPSVLLNDTQVKDTLYAKVFFENDSVRCIYSGLAHNLPNGVDPSQWLFGSGNEVGSINLEHGWPQAKGAGEGTDGNMNMYHLFPSRVEINSDRADYPFGEINDNDTQTWYYLDQELSFKPSMNIDAYSEFDPGFFEPRESVKGDIARAMFYFWTIYREDALAADPTYFEQQREFLCQWHEQDPVDDFEILRNERIAFYQGGKMNPFILDCSLAERSYCNIYPGCLDVPVLDVKNDDSKFIYDTMLQRFQMVSGANSFWKVIIADMDGRIIYSMYLESNNWSADILLAPGMYVACSTDGIEMIVSKFLKL